MGTGGSALKRAADEIVRKAKRPAGWIMEVAKSDVVLERGVFRVEQATGFCPFIKRHHFLTPPN
jgi:hypothetical protein